MIHFKATRPDGTDFYTGTIDYAAALASGEVIRHPSPEMVRDDAATYLSVSTSAADCAGFWWPCRLFAVEPVGDTMTGLEVSPSKVACSALRVIREEPAWWAFGPQGREVVSLLERLRRVTAAEANRLTAAWAAAWDAAWDAAWAAAGDAAWAAAREAAQAAAWDAAWAAAGGAAGGAAWDAAWATAWAAARDAAWALIVRDIITPEHYETLVAPWVAVMGRDLGEGLSL